ncbi:hypothetical protein ACJZ2D_009148 [Fusarium nematophilum]
MADEAALTQLLHLTVAKPRSSEAPPAPAEIYPVGAALAGISAPTATWLRLVTFLSSPSTAFASVPGTSRLGCGFRDAAHCLEAYLNALSPPKSWTDPPETSRPSLLIWDSSKMCF